MYYEHLSWSKNKIKNKSLDVCGITVWGPHFNKKFKVICMLWKIFYILSMLEGGIENEDLLYVFLIIQMV